MTRRRYDPDAKLNREIKRTQLAILRAKLRAICPEERAKAETQRAQITARNDAELYLWAERIVARMPRPDILPPRLPPYGSKTGSSLDKDGGENKDL